MAASPRPRITAEELTAPQTVDVEVRGARLVDWLQGQWPEVDRAFLRQLAQDGLVRVNFMDAGPRSRLHPGDHVEITMPPGIAEPPLWRAGTSSGRGDSELRILAETDWALVVDKPAGLPTLADRAGKNLGVHGRLAALRPDEDLRIAHRLDKDTSGCLVLAKSLDAARWLDARFRAREVRKEYRALVEGEVFKERFEVRKFLGPDKRRPGLVAVVKEGSKGAREAHTEVEVDERFRGFTWLAVRPRTGRGHQIRVHLKSAGHPIVGDVDYGSKGPLLLSRIKRGYKVRPGLTETPLTGRICLHAARIEVPAPDGAEPLVAESPLPDDLDKALDKLRRFAPARRDASTQLGGSQE